MTTAINQSMPFDIESLVREFENSPKEFLKRLIFNFNQVENNRVDLELQQESTFESTISEEIKDSTKIIIDWPVSSEFKNKASEECVEFCNSKGIIDSLRKCLQQISLIFKCGNDFYADYDCFDEEDGETEGHVVIRVNVNCDRRTALQDYEKWVDWKIENLLQNTKYFTLTFRRNM